VQRTTLFLFSDPQPCLADLTRYYLQQRVGSGAARVGASNARSAGVEGMDAPEGSTYLPMCRKDGTYAAVQCHAGYCWCVTRRGRFVKGSTVKGSRPKCARAMKTRRGSSPGHRLHKRGDRNTLAILREDKNLKIQCTKSQKKIF